MAQLDIFVSFEFDRDNDLKNSFYEQAERYAEHRIRNCSLREAYPTEEWKGKARAAILDCDVVILLVGQDTHNAPGVLTEVRIASLPQEAGLSGRTGEADLHGSAGLGASNPVEVEEHQQAARGVWIQRRLESNT